MIENAMLSAAQKTLPPVAECGRQERMRGYNAGLRDAETLGRRRDLSDETAMFRAGYNVGFGTAMINAGYDRTLPGNDR